ncbi:MAG: ATP-binding protein [Bacteroidota bacterium]
MMRKTGLYTILLIVLLGSVQVAKSQQPESEILEIKVNNIQINLSDEKDIVVRQSDTITFKYVIKNIPKNAGNSFYYRVVLRTKQDSSFKVTGSDVVQYSDLFEDNYTFVAGGFDLQGRWIAKTSTITFRVNNREAELLDKLKQYEKHIEKLEKMVPQKTKISSFLFDRVSLIFGLTFGIIIASTIFFIYVGIKNKKNKGEIMDELESIVITKEEYNKIMSENSNLRAEISALRGQIDALQARSNDMRKQNKELQEKLNHLSNSKAELENLQQQKDELFALIIHDIKNPAALIKSLVDLLRSYDLSAVEKQEIIEDIAETTARIVSLSQEVTKILALETTKLELNIEATPIADLVEDVVNRNFVSAKSKNIEMTFDIAKNLPEIEIDAQKIDEVLDNLVSNAIKFTQKGGKVHVRSYLEDNKVIVEVNDNGLGLTEDDIKRAFQRGNKLSAQPTGGETSTGLGLWIVKKLVDAHNGRVWVKSTLGKGSSFTFSLPIKQKKEEVTA